MSEATAVTSGHAHTCAIHSGGAVACWGSTAWGQLGTGADITGTGSSPTPVPVSGLEDATAIAAGSEHTCAIRSGGSVTCWGNNAWGQLGDGSKTHSSVPVAVATITNATAITAGGGNSCALEADGEVACWGQRYEPAPVVLAKVTGATAVTTAVAHTCALRSEGTIVCLGQQVYGELGVVTQPPDALTPVQVTGITDATGIAAAAGQGNHTCAIVSGGGVMCWGSNGSGQLGDGTLSPPTEDLATQCSRPCSRVPVAVVGISDATAIAAGHSNSCALLTGGGVVCWGSNASGALGNGSRQDSPTPVAVTGL